MENGKTYHIRTFGCQMNVRDSETAAGLLEQLGYSHSDDMSKADVILFNTCCIRELAEKKAESAIGSVKAYKAQDASRIVGVFGCMTQQDEAPARLMGKFPFIDFVFGTNNLHSLPALIEAAKHDRRTALTEIGEAESDFDLPVRYNKLPLAYVNIMFGCNNFCSYCIVPYVRGREASRPMQLIIDEIKQLVDAGYKEVTLLGQNVNSYGKGIDDSFPGLLRAADKTGIKRLRFMTSHPKDLSDDMIAAMAECSSVCKQLHLPVQSGSDGILKAMNRHYDSAHYMGLIEKLRNAMPDIGLTTDIIVGFPGETEKDFDSTLSLIKQVKYDSAFMFAYSPRSGTKAAAMPGQLPDGEKQRRLQQLIDTQSAITMEVHQGLVGSRSGVLAEHNSKKDDKHLTGRLERGITVNFEGSPDTTGSIINVEITQAKRNTLFGKVV